ncbi:MAG: hypothetical protein Ct9H300mP5_4000 [Candidatus Pelagibacterales bacterium]|nr:MAG: hypothetical protein Ct9H300mP5_4000 [Pelagibacterales bacterium]
MSFSVKCQTKGLEYNGTSINGLFAQRLNLLKPSFLLMVKDILRFNRDAKVFLKNSVEEITFGDFLNRGGYSNSLKNDYALPMASAIWSPNRTLSRMQIFVSSLNFLKIMECST